MSSETSIRVRNLSKVFTLGLSGRTNSLATVLKERLRHPVRGGGDRRQRFRALDDVTFDVAAGECVGVIGKNGAGKSTLLKILSRITPPSEGHIEMEGTVGSLLEVGTGFHQELTGLENVYLNGTILGMSRRQIDAKLEEIVDFADIHKFLETPVKRYSSGMRVRLAFAVAAHLEPDVMIVDEVLSVGDAGFQSKCLDKMRSIAADDGRTILYVSHNLATVEHLCPRALLLVEGRLVFDGDTKETVSQYLDTFPRAERGGQRGVFDLTTADRSSGNYDAVFQRLEIRTTGGIVTETVRMGEPLQLAIDVEGLSELADPLVTVTAGSSVSQCVFRMTSRMIGLKAASARRLSETIVVDVPSVPLTPGEYFLDLQIKGKDTRGTIDFVHRAGEFTVISADVYGTGFEYTAHDGIVAVPWGWEVRPLEPRVADPEPTRAPAVGPGAPAESH